MEKDLTVAVTGPTGTLGFGLMPQLQADDRVSRVVGVARRPFDPAGYGWTKLEYRRGDVRDPEVLREAFKDADVVVHLAFLVTGAAGAQEIESVNVGGTRNAFTAAARAGARRFVFASSVAAYGFHSDNPVGMTEDWPVRPARLFYAREKARLEQLLWAEADRAQETGLYLLRPSVVLGPHVMGAKGTLPGLFGPLARILSWCSQRVLIPLPDLPVQLVHEQDAGQALLNCAVAAGPPGAYNIAADGTVTTGAIARELGWHPLPVPAGAARALSVLPFLPPVAQWVEAVSHPAIMDTARAKRDLGWTPRFTAAETLRDTARRWHSGLSPSELGTAGSSPSELSPSG